MIGSSVDVEVVETKTETFVLGTYNGIEIVSRKSDGYINASLMCQKLKGTNDSQFRRFLRENKSWAEYFDEFVKDFRSDENGRALPDKEFIENCYTKYPNAYRGIYVHPGLINYIAMWASPKYAVYVGRIMDKINERMHENLEEKGLADNPINAIDALNEVTEPIFNPRANDSREAQAWGCRDSPYCLDQWEKVEMQDAMIQYLLAKEKLQEWDSFIPQYYPEFKY